MLSAIHGFNTLLFLALHCTALHCTALHSHSHSHSHRTAPHPPSRSLSEEDSKDRFDDADGDMDGLVSWQEYKAEEYDFGEEEVGRREKSESHS